MAGAFDPAGAFKSLVAANDTITEYCIGSLQSPARRDPIKHSLSQLSEPDLGVVLTLCVDKSKAALTIRQYAPASQSTTPVPPPVPPIDSRMRFRDRRKITRGATAATGATKPEADTRRRL